MGDIVPFDRIRMRLPFVLFFAAAVSVGRSFCQIVAGWFFIGPEPAQSIGQAIAGPIRVVASRSHHQSMFVAGESKRGRQVLVGQWPVAEEVIQILVPFLEIDLDRFRIFFASCEQIGIGPATSNIGKLPI